MPRVTLDGVGIFYQEAGPSEAEALLLIMGWGGDHTAWAFQVPALARTFRVVALDNRGAGQSDVPEAPWTIADMARDAVALMDALGIRRAHVWGASMGGMIAQELALGHPDRVLTLGLHCTAARVDPYGRLLIQSLLALKARLPAEEYVRAGVPWILARRTVAERPEFVQAWIDRAVAYPYPTGLAGLTRQAEAVLAHETLDRLDRIRGPTLVTTGAEDILVPPARSREIHARIPGSKLVVIPDAGHVHFLEQPEAFNEAGLRFLLEPRPRP